MKKNLFLFLLLIIAGGSNAQGQNLLANGSFENDFQQWSNLSGGGGAATFSIATTDVYDGTKAMKVDVTTPGANAWDIQSIGSVWASVTGKEYKLSFYAKATTMGAQFKAVQQTNTYAAKDFTLTTSWQKYEWTFTAKEDLLQFKIHYFATGTFLIDKISIESTALQTQNLISNGGFESDFNQWNNIAGGGGSSANFSIETASVAEGNKAMKVEIITPGVNAWDIQSINSAWASQQGKEYTVTFFARAAADGTQFRVVQQANTYSAKDFTLTTIWQKYEWTFTAKEDFLQLKFHFFAAGTIYIDNISIPTPVVQQSLLNNGGFENDFNQWSNIAGGGGSVANFSIQTSDVAEGNKAMKADVLTAGSNPWDVQSINSPWASQTGTEYKLTFFAKSATDGGQFRVVIQANTYSSKDFILTTSWKQYDWVFTAKEEFLQLKFHFFTAGTFYLDGFSILAPASSVDTGDKLTVDTNVHFQTMDGFGGGLAFYENWLTAHPKKEELYQLIFKDLGIDWLRLRNTYRYQVPFTSNASELVQKANTYTEDSVRILMSSWSPPANLKSNNNTNNGTLKKENGVFVYDKFAQYWKDALVEYEKLGVKPKWISIQNEPDWLTNDWETNKFTPIETADFPGYDQALDAVYDKIKNLNESPRLLGAEPLGIGYGNFDKYTQPIKSKSYLYGYAYHLYHGGDPNLPDSYNSSLKNIADNYNDRPNIMTEYEHFNAGWLKSAWLINNVITQANASAYFYWDLVWPNSGLIDIDNPWDQSQWENANGYSIHPQYYAVKHFSKHIKPGYKRVSLGNANSSIRSSAFISPSGKELVIVMINTSGTHITSTVAAQDWKESASTVYQSTEGNFYQAKASLDSTMQVLLPAYSVTTIILKKVLVAGKTYSLFAKHSGKVLGIKSGATKNGIDIKQYDVNNTNSQKWKLEDAGDGYFKLTIVASDKSLSIAKASIKKGAKAEQWQYIGGDDQKWKIEEVGDGFYKLIAKHSGKSLTVSKGQIKDNTTVEQQDYTGVDYQLWKFEVTVPIVENAEETLTRDGSEDIVLTLFPNPSSDGRFALELTNFDFNDKITITVTDSNGNLIKTREIKNADDLSFDHKLKQGLYFVTFTSKKDTIIKRLLVP